MYAIWSLLHEQMYMKLEIHMQKMWTHTSFYVQRPTWKNHEICKKGWTCIYITYVVIDRLKNVTPPLPSDRHLEVQSVLDVGDNSTADKWPTTHPCQGYPDPMLSVRLWNPQKWRDWRHLWWIPTNQDMDTYKLKRWIPTNWSDAFPQFAINSTFLTLWTFWIFIIFVEVVLECLPVMELHLHPLAIWFGCRRASCWRNGHPWQGSASARAWLQMDTGSQCLPRTKTSGAKPTLLLSKFLAWAHIAQISSTLGNGCSQHRTVVALQPVPYGVSRPLGTSISPMGASADGSAFEITLASKTRKSFCIQLWCESTIDSYWTNCMPTKTRIERTYHRRILLIDLARIWPHGNWYCSGSHDRSDIVGLLALAMSSSCIHLWRYCHENHAGSGWRKVCLCVAFAVLHKLNTAYLPLLPPSLAETSAVV